MRRTIQPAQPVQPRANFVSIIAWVQFISAAITAALALYPSMFLVVLPLLFIGISIWFPGVHLLHGYWLFATHRRAPASSMALWVLSLIYNAIGLVLVLHCLFSDCIPYASSPEFPLLILPPLIGIVLGILGMIAAYLESKS